MAFLRNLTLAALTALAVAFGTCGAWAQAPQVPEPSFDIPSWDFPDALKDTSAKVEPGNWVSLGGQIVGEPSLVYGKAYFDVFEGTQHYLMVVARGSDNALWYRMKFLGQAWQPWTSLGGELTSSPVCVTRDRTVDCLMSGKDHTLAQRSYVLAPANAKHLKEIGSWGDWSFPRQDLIVTGRVDLDKLSDAEMVATAGGGYGDKPFGLYRARWSKLLGWTAWKPIQGTEKASVQRFDCNDNRMALPQPAAGQPTPEPILIEACLIGDMGANGFSFDVRLSNSQKSSKSAGKMTKILSPYPPSVIIEPDPKSPSGQTLLVHFTNLADGALYRARYNSVTGWKVYKDKSTHGNYGGVLTSGPNCLKERVCAGRGQDGAVWVMGIEEK